MLSIRRKLRPKHQVLVLKCYPPPQKNAIEYKPNSSELSYLLYYASTRRSKLQKVGDFLEKKTSTDVHHGRTGEVLITLQIVRALIEKCPRALPLYCHYILSIFSTILKSHDAALVEASLGAWDMFCIHYNPTPLAGDHNHNLQYDETIQQWTSYASKSSPISQKGKPSIPLAQRYRTAGLKGIKSLVSSEQFQTHNERHLRLLIPVILQNLDSERPKHFSLLRLRENTKDKAEKEVAYRARQSIALGRSTDSLEADPEDARATAANLDEKADQDVAVLALQALRQIFTANDHSYVRAATSSMLHYITVRQHTRKSRLQSKDGTHDESSWSEEMFELVCEWTAVQSRYIILVYVTDRLSRSPVIEHDLDHQVLLASIIGWLLRSTVNFYGLNVIDIVVELVQHILLLLQLRSPQSRLRNASGSRKGSKTASRRSSPVAIRGQVETVTTASPTRRRLLDDLQGIIGDVATHTYYADQIGDTVSALLERMKPMSNTAIPHTASAIENPGDAAEAIAAATNLQHDSHTDPFFSFDTARLLALGAVKRVLFVANARQKNVNNAMDRNRVGISAWEGTQWLLCDPNAEVRRAYVDALLTWLDLEVDKTNLVVIEDNPSKAKRAKKPGDRPIESTLTKRAVSNASKVNKTPLIGQSMFLQLLHLAIYDNAFQHAESEPDLLLLHLLLSRLISGLGVNGVRHGLPMIFRLQEDIALLESPSAKIAIGSLVYGYFVSLSKFFDFEATSLGRAIINEVNRRKAKILDFH